MYIKYLQLRISPQPGQAILLVFAFYFLCSAVLQPVLLGFCTFFPQIFAQKERHHSLRSIRMNSSS
jgi:hypothetical protein